MLGTRVKVLWIAAAAMLTVMPAYAESPHLSSTELNRLERTTAAIRELQPKHSVRAVFLNSSRFQAAFSESAHKSTPDTEISLSQRELSLLGLLGPHADLRRTLFQDLAPQVGGFYDARQKTLFVRSTGDHASELRRDLIAHEYTHALQDQYYNLQRLTPDPSKLTYRNTDAAAAHKALIEGDAVNTQNLFIYKTYSASEIKRLIQSQSSGKPTPALPPVIQRTFDFQYTAGLAFVQRIYRNSGMPGVDAAYRRTPTSTYEILFPWAYLQHWHPASVTLRAIHGFEDWSLPDDDVWGALGYELLLWQFSDKARAEAIISSYRGDRYVLLQRNDQSAMLFQSRWANQRAARATRTALIAAIKTRAQRSHSQVSVSGNLVTFGSGGLYCRVNGTLVTMALAPTPMLAFQLGTAPTT